jgi:hypothetical protein
VNHKLYTVATYDYRDLNMVCCECGKITPFIKIRVGILKELECRHCKKKNEVELDFKNR